MYYSMNAKKDEAYFSSYLERMKEKPKNPKEADVIMLLIMLSRSSIAEYQLIDEYEMETDEFEMGKLIVEKAAEKALKQRLSNASPSLFYPFLRGVMIGLLDLSATAERLAAHDPTHIDGIEILIAILDNIVHFLAEYIKNT